MGFIARVVAGMELNFSIAAHTVPCVGSVTKTVLINTDGLAVAEQCLHSVKAFSVSHPAPPASRLGVGKELGGDTAGTSDPI